MVLSDVPVGFFRADIGGFNGLYFKSGGGIVTHFDIPNDFDDGPIEEGQLVWWDSTQQIVQVKNYYPVNVRLTEY